VKQTVRVRVVPTPEQAAALLDTLNVCNSAASWLSAQMRTAGVFGKFDVHKRFYALLRERFGLVAQPTIRVIGKTCDAYTTLRANLTAGNCGQPGSQRRRKIEATPITFRPQAAQPFDARCLSWQLGDVGREGGFVGHADHNAAHNIAQRGVVCWGEAMRPHAAPTLAAGQDGSSKPIGTPQGKDRATSPILQRRVHGDATR
jgi:hypothetical protein